MTTLVIEMSPRMAKLVSKATDVLDLPTNQDFALKAMGLLLRSMGLAPKLGRPLGYSQRRRSNKSKPTRETHDRRDAGGVGLATRFGGRRESPGRLGLKG